MYAEMDRNAFDAMPMPQQVPFTSTRTQSTHRARSNMDVESEPFYRPWDREAATSHLKNFTPLVYIVRKATGKDKFCMCFLDANRKQVNYKFERDKSKEEFVVEGATFKTIREMVSKLGVSPKPQPYIGTIK